MPWKTKMRAEQREATKEQIVNAALLAISESGFDGISTRAIAARAKVSQGLLTYHFKSKELLWRAAADHMFGQLNQSVDKVLALTESLDATTQRRMLIREMVQVSATHPEFMRFMMEHAKENSDRSRWLVDTHVSPIYQRFTEIMDHIPKADIPHMFYILAGASGIIFCAQHECKRMTGINPSTNASIKRHADLLIDLFVPAA